MMSEQEKKMNEAGFTHPCKGSCSGYEQGFQAGWQARDSKLSAIIFNKDETISMKDPVEIALLSFTNGYARGIKDKEIV